MIMKYLEKLWPGILAFWIALGLTSVAVKMIFFNKINRNTLTIKEMIQGIAQNDSRLQEYIQKQHIFPPPSKVPYNLRENSHLNKKNSLVIHHINKLLNDKTNGLFIEYRAYDGELMSKTLYFEITKNWTGLLIEPDPLTFTKLISKRRRAWLSNSCVSPDPVALTLDFMQKIDHPSPILPRDNHNNNTTKAIYSSNNNATKITFALKPSKKKLWKNIKVPCFPIFSLVSAVGLNPLLIDYFNLDAQGMEMQILYNIPWNSVLIKIISVNIQWIPDGVDEIKLFMESKEYWLVAQVYQEYIFAHRSLKRR